MPHAIRISPGLAATAATWMAIGLLLLLISAPLGLQLRTELARRHNYVALVALVFPKAGLLMTGKPASPGFA